MGHKVGERRKFFTVDYKPNWVRDRRLLVTRKCQEAKGSDLEIVRIITVGRIIMTLIFKIIVSVWLL